MSEADQRKTSRFAPSLIVGIALMSCFFVMALFVSSYIFLFPLLGAFLTGLVVGFLIPDKATLVGFLSVAVALFLFVTFGIRTGFGKFVFSMIGVFYIGIAVICAHVGAIIAGKRFGAKLITLVVLLTLTSTTFVAAYTFLLLPKLITHSGDLIISGNQTFTIENCVYQQDGNIIVKDNATLLVRNATLTMAQREREYRIDIKNQAHLIAENARLTVLTTGKIGMFPRSKIHIWDNATVKMENTTLGGLDVIDHR